MLTDADKLRMITEWAETHATITPYTQYEEGQRAAAVRILSVLNHKD